MSNDYFETYYSGSDVNVFVSGFSRILLDEVSYIQWSSQSGVVPVFSVFGYTPVGVLQTTVVWKGVIGFNLKYATYLRTLAASDNATYNKKKSVVMSNGTIYFPHMEIHLKQTGDIKTWYELNDVYIFGGVKTAVPDGAPIQDVYQFLALRGSGSDSYAPDSIRPDVNIAPNMDNF